MFIFSRLNVDGALTDFFVNVEKLRDVASERSPEMSDAGGKLNLSPSRLAEPRKWRGCRRCVFFCRMIITHPVVCQPHKYFMSRYRGFKKMGSTVLKQK